GLTARALRDRLEHGTAFDDGGSNDVNDAKGKAKWPAGANPSRPSQFGYPLVDIRTIVVHNTSGWPTRAKKKEFVDRYINGAAPNGVGPAFLVSGDGSVFQVALPNLVTWHATYVNSWSIGVETGNLDYGDSATDDKPPKRLPGWLAPKHDSAKWPG